MKTSVTAEEAIRQVILDGAQGDFCDVVDIVRRRFGLRVGTGLVEQVYRKFKDEAARTEDDSVSPDASAGSTKLSHSAISSHENAKESTGPGRIGVGLRAGLSGPDRSVSVSDDRGQLTESAESSRTRVLEFVEVMGGFDAARDAITEVEKSLKDLMES